MKNYLELVPISAKLHRKQGRMTRICIFLSVFLVTVIFGMAEAAIRGQQYREIKQGGNWHVVFQEIDEETATLISVRPEVVFSGWSISARSPHKINEMPLSLGGMNEDTCKAVFPYVVTEGTYPKTTTEILLSESAKLLLQIEIGDKVSVDGKDFSVSGFMETSANQSRTDSISAYLTMDGFSSIEENGNMILVAQLSKFCNMMDTIVDMRKQLNLTEKQAVANGNLLMLLGQSDNTYILALYGCAAVLFFMVLIAGVLMIASSLNSNVLQRVTLFGMLRCIGATQKQIKRIVLREGLNWCKLSIPFGVLAGVAVAWGLSAMLRWLVPSFFGALPIFHVSILSVVCGTIVGLLTVLLAAHSPAKKAASVSPLTAVSGNAQTMQPVKRAANTQFCKIETSLGTHRAISGRKNFLMMVGSYALSITLFLAFSPLIDLMHHSLKVLRPSAPDYSITAETGVPKSLADELDTLSFVKNAYGKTIQYDVGAEGAYNIGTCDDLQFSWAERDLLEGSIDLQENEVLAVLNELFELSVGDSVQLKNGHIVQIVGILSQSPYSFATNTECLICTEETYESIFGEAPYNILDVQFTRDVTDNDVAELRTLVGEDFSFSDSRQSNSEAMGAYFSLSLFVYGFLVIIALITIFNIVNTVNMGVSAHIKQYGAMRAIGMSTRQLVRMVRAEAVTYAVTGSVVGWLLGVYVHRLLFLSMITNRWGDKWNAPILLLLMVAAVVILSAYMAVYQPTKRIRDLSIVDTISAE